jgi:hypothetical protein
MQLPAAHALLQQLPGSRLRYIGRQYGQLLRIASLQGLQTVRMAGHAYHVGAIGQQGFSRGMAQAGTGACYHK